MSKLLGQKIDEAATRVVREAVKIVTNAEIERETSVDFPVVL